MLRLLETLKPTRRLALAAAITMVALGLVAWLHGGPVGAGAQTKPAQKPPEPSPTEIAGLAALEARLGKRAPRGEGIVAGHVEGSLPSYLPQMTDARYQGLRIRAGSGKGEFNDHTHATAKIIYGPRGWAPGIPDVTFFTTSHWLGPGCLHANTTQPPDAGEIRIFNHSWIAGGNEAEVLRRVDYLVDERDVIMVVGVNNNRSSAVPDLLAASYNAIAVGSGTGNSSGGFTRAEVTGRCKPDVVAPFGLTSFATPGVTACAARLLEVADAMKRDGRTNLAGRSEVIKAVLLGGAAKDASWAAAPGKPLHQRQGAGMVRIDRSYDLLTTGPAEPGALASRYGWAFRELAREAKENYTFQSPRALGEAALTLVWNRRVEGGVTRDMLTGRTRWNTATRLADFDLRLFRTDKEGNESELAVSASAIDNVEHIFLRELSGGRYRIEVSRKDTLDEPYDYALVWRIEPTPPPAPATTPAAVR